MVIRGVVKTNIAARSHVALAGAERQVPQEFVEPLSQIFYRYGHGGVVGESEGGFNPDEGESASPDSWVTLKTYLPVNSTARERKARIDLGVRLVAHVSPISPLSQREIDEQEWQDSWKEHFDVLRVGRRLVVCPTWREYHPTATDIVLSLDPGMAFGTGHTRLPGPVLSCWRSR